MKVKGVALTVGGLFLVLLIWFFVFANNGALVTGVNAGVGVINSAWETVTGNEQLIPLWGNGGVDYTGEDSNVEESGW